MSTPEELKAELSSLQEKLATIQSQGRVLTDCWIAKAKPGSNVLPEKLFSVKRTVQQLLTVIDRLQQSDSGEFFSWDGSRLAW